MKANAPEKLYIFNPEKREVWFSKTSDKQVEYIRTDAFIEKAAKFLDENLYTYDNSSGRGLWTEVIADMEFDTVEEFIEDFRKYMEGD
jgi:hypothetical protein